MDDLFREIVDYQRRVGKLRDCLKQRCGGFLKWGYPSSIWGYPNIWKPPCRSHHLDGLGPSCLQVVEVGGFWQIEDEIAEQEESRRHRSRFKDIMGGEHTQVDIQ